jgi:lysophospholipase L1-like esterase
MKIAAQPVMKILKLHLILKRKVEFWYHGLWGGDGGGPVARGAWVFGGGLAAGLTGKGGTVRALTVGGDLMGRDMRGFGGMKSTRACYTKQLRFAEVER